MKFTKTEDVSQVAAGAYQAVFCDCRDWEPPEGVERKYDRETVELLFKILGGPHDQQMVTRLCGKTFHPKGVLYGFAKALNGGKGPEEFDFDDHIGRRGQLIVEAEEGKRSKPGTFIADMDAPLDKDAAEVPF